MLQQSVVYSQTNLKERLREYNVGLGCPVRKAQIVSFTVINETHVHDTSLFPRHSHSSVHVATTNIKHMSCTNSAGVSLVPRRLGGERERLVHTVRACA